jgi:probable rRNA maturation factor
MKPMKVDIHRQTRKFHFRSVRVVKHLFKTIEDNKTMDLILVDDETIKQLNKTYRHIDRSTDVLSFPDDTPDAPSLGDVFISVETAKRQAHTLGHSFAREIGFLSVHGYLHLKGYDHHTPEEEAKMIETQERILKNAGLERINQ